MHKIPLALGFLLLLAACKGKGGSNSTNPANPWHTYQRSP